MGSLQRVVWKLFVERGRERDSFGHETAFSNAEAITAVERGALTNGGLRQPPRRGHADHFLRDRSRDEDKRPLWALQLEICCDYRLSRRFLIRFILPLLI